MKKFVAMILMVVMMVTIGCTANAVYDEETEMIDFDLVCTLLGMGMKPNFELDDEGFVWTRSCELSTFLKEMEDDNFVGEGTVYMVYSVYDDIGTITITGNFTYDDIDLSFYQLVFRHDEELGGLEVITEGIDEIYW